MYGNQVPVIELSFIDNFSWKKLSLNLTREIAVLEQEEYMYENCRDNKYLQINLDTEVRNNDSITKIWLCKIMSEKRGWQVTKSPPLNPPLMYVFTLTIRLVVPRNLHVQIYIGFYMWQKQMYIFFSHMCSRSYEKCVSVILLPVSNISQYNPSSDIS